MLIERAGEAPRADVVAPVGGPEGAAAIVAALGKVPTPPAGEAGAAERLAALRRSVPQAGSPDLQLLRRIGAVDPTDLDAYRAAGGYRALARAIELGPERVIAEVTASKLVGRGGAAFPTGRKWEAVAARRPGRTTWSATPTSPSPGPSRTAC